MRKIFFFKFVFVYMETFNDIINKQLVKHVGKFIRIDGKRTYRNFFEHFF